MLLEFERQTVGQASCKYWQLSGEENKRKKASLLSKGPRKQAGSAASSCMAEGEERLQKKNGNVHCVARPASQSSNLVLLRAGKVQVCHQNQVIIHGLFQSYYYY